MPMRGADSRRMGPAGRSVRRPAKKTTYKLPSGPRGDAPQTRKADMRKAENYKKTGAYKLGVQAARATNPTRQRQYNKNAERALEVRRTRLRESKRAATATRIGENRRPIKPTKIGATPSLLTKLPTRKGGKATGFDPKAEGIARDIKIAYKKGESLRLKDKEDAQNRLKEQGIFIDNRPKTKLKPLYIKTKGKNKYEWEKVEPGTGGKIKKVYGVMNAKGEFKQSQAPPDVIGNILSAAGKQLKDQGGALVHTVGNAAKIVGGAKEVAESIGNATDISGQKKIPKGARATAAGLNAPGAVNPSVANTIKHGALAGGSVVLDYGSRPVSAVEAGAARGLVAAGVGGKKFKARVKGSPNVAEAFLHKMNRRTITGADLTEAVGLPRELGLAPDLLLDPTMYAGLAAAPFTGGASLALIAERIMRVAPQLAKSDKVLKALELAKSADKADQRKALRELQDVVRSKEFKQARRDADAAKWAAANERRASGGRSVTDAKGRTTPIDLPGRSGLDAVEAAIRGAEARRTKIQPRLGLMTPLGRRIQVRGRELAVPLTPDLGKLPLPRGNKSREALITEHAMNARARVDEQERDIFDQLDQRIEEARRQRDFDTAAELEKEKIDWKTRFEHGRADVTKAAEKELGFRKRMQTVDEAVQGRKMRKQVHQGVARANALGRTVDRKVAAAVENAIRDLGKGKVLMNADERTRSLERVQMWLNTHHEGGGANDAVLGRAINLTPQEQRAANNLMEAQRAFADHNVAIDPNFKAREGYTGNRIWNQNDTIEAIAGKIAGMGKGKPGFSHHRSISEVSEFASKEQMARAIQRLADEPISTEEAFQIADEVWSQGRHRLIADITMGRLQRGEEVMWDDLGAAQREVIDRFARVSPDPTKGGTPLFRTPLTDPSTEGRVLLNPKALDEMGLTQPEAFTNQEIPALALAAKLDSQRLATARAGMDPDSQYATEIDVLIEKLNAKGNEMHPAYAPVKVEDVPPEAAREAEEAIDEVTPAPATPEPAERVSDGAAADSGRAGTIKPGSHEIDLETPIEPKPEPTPEPNLTAGEQAKLREAKIVNQAIIKKREENGGVLTAPQSKMLKNTERIIEKLERKRDAKPSLQERAIPTREELREREYRGSEQHRKDAEARLADLEEEREAWGKAENPTFRRPKEGEDLDQVEPAIWVSKQNVDDNRPALLITAKDQDGQYHIYRWDPEDADYHHVGSDATIKGAKSWAAGMAQEYSARVAGDIVNHRKWMADEFKDLPSQTLDRIRRTPEERGGSPFPVPDKGSEVTYTRTTIDDYKPSPAQRVRLQKAKKYTPNPKLKRKWDLDDADVKRAADELGIEKPVEVHVVGGNEFTNPQYIGFQDGKHQILMPNWTKPADANKHIWEELVHARQLEQNPAGWKAEMEKYLALREQGRDAVRGHKWEREADEVGQPFVVVTPRRTPEPSPEPHTIKVVKPTEVEQPPRMAEPEYTKGVEETTEAMGGAPREPAVPREALHEGPDIRETLPDFRSQGDTMVSLDPRQMAYYRGRGEGLKAQGTALFQGFDKVYGRQAFDPRMYRTRKGDIRVDKGTGEHYYRPHDYFGDFPGISTIDENRVWPASVIRALEKDLKTQGAYDQVFYQGVEAGWGKVMASLRFGVTTPFPAYHIRNLVSDALKSLQADSGVIFHPIVNARLALAAYGKGEARDFKVPGMPKMKMADFLHMADVLGVKETHHLDEVAQIIKDGKIKSGFLSRHPHVANSWWVPGGKSTRFGMKRENIVRLQTFVQRLRANGGDSADAAWYTIKHHFDYADLTATEKRFVRNVFLFYTWYRKNIPLQLAELMRRPGFFTAMATTYRDLEAGETPVNVGPFAGGAPAQPALPDYVKDTLQSATASWNGHALNVGFGAPWADLAWLSQDGFQASQTLVNPIIGQMVQQLDRQDPLTRRTYKDNEPSQVAEILESLGVEGIEKDDKGRAVLPWRFAIALRQLPLIGRGTASIGEVSGTRDQGRLSRYGKWAAPVTGLNIYVSPKPGTQREKLAIEGYLRGRASERMTVSFNNSQAPKKVLERKLKEFDAETLADAKRRGITKYLKTTQRSGFYKAKPRKKASSGGFNLGG